METIAGLELSDNSQSTDAQTTNPNPHTPFH